MPQKKIPIGFSGSPLDRASHRRTDQRLLAQMLRAGESRVAPFFKQKPFFHLARDEADPLSAAFLPWPAIEALALSEPTVVFLGLQEATPYFAVDVSDLEEPETQGPLAGLGRFIDLRTAASTLGAEDAAILAQAKALIDWHARHRFCAACGAKTVLADGGYRRTCVSCHADHFPRTDPVVIMLAFRQGRALLGRGARFPLPMFSTLAGFVEPGETIEEAVAREVKEETSVHVGRVRFVASQPWPFPSSLMIGCLAEALSEEIEIDGSELIEARWFSRADVAAALARPEGTGTLRVPPAFAIAHQLMRVWVEESDEAPLRAP